MDLGQRLKRVRERKGLSLRQLSELSGVERGLISKLERGQRPQVSVPVAMRLAKALGVTLDYLAGMYEEEDTDPAPALVPARN
jgi:transcriptional regulator with XRE-family HTH domain